MVTGAALALAFCSGALSQVAANLTPGEVLFGVRAAEIGQWVDQRQRLDRADCRNGSDGSHRYGCLPAPTLAALRLYIRERTHGEP